MEVIIVGALANNFSRLFMFPTVATLKTFA